MTHAIRWSVQVVSLATPFQLFIGTLLLGVAAGLIGAFFAFIGGK